MQALTAHTALGGACTGITNTDREDIVLVLIDHVCLIDDLVGIEGQQADHRIVVC